MALSVAASCSSVLVHFLLGAVASDLTLGKSPTFPQTAARTSGQFCFVHSVLSFKNVTSVKRPKRSIVKALLRKRKTLKKGTKLLGRDLKKLRNSQNIPR